MECQPTVDREAQPVPEAIDLVRSDSSYYSASTTPELVEFSPVRALAFEGRGAPGGADHLSAIEMLYAVMHGVQALANEMTPFLVPPLEGLWWIGDDRLALEVPREEWRWQVLLRLPSDDASGWIDEARAQAGDDARSVQLATLAEGLCVQALHRGPYETEPETIAAMDALMEREQLTMNGRHHEIYLTAVTEQLPPNEIRTILRHPVRPLGR
jgi:hypothetical protein